MEGISLEVMDHIEEMQKKMSMMQEQMRRNMELMVKSKNLNQGGFHDDDGPNIYMNKNNIIVYFILSYFFDVLSAMSYIDIKRDIEEKTKQLMEGTLNEKQKEAVNIDLERVLLYYFLLLDTTKLTWY